MTGLWDALTSQPKLSKRSFSIIMDIVSRIQSDNQSEVARFFVEHGIRRIGDFLPAAIASGQRYEQIHRYPSLLTKLCEPETIEGCAIFAEARKQLVQQILWHISQPNALETRMIT